MKSLEQKIIVRCKNCGWRIFDKVTMTTGVIELKCPNCHRVVEVDLSLEPTVVSVAAILISIPRKRRLANAKSRCWISSKKHSLWKKKDRSFLIFIVKLL